MRKLIEGRDFSKCRCGRIKSADAKQCRECYRANNGMWSDKYSVSGEMRNRAKCREFLATGEAEKE